MHPEIPNPEARLFGQRLKAIRQSAGPGGKKLSIGELANGLHIHKGTLSKIENGKIQPPRARRFYERLTEVIGEDKVKLLFQSDNTPHWLTHDVEIPFIEVLHGGVRVSVYAAPERFTSIEQEALRAWIKLSVEDFIQNREAQTNRSSNLI